MLTKAEEEDSILDIGEAMDDISDCEIKANKIGIKAISKLVIAMMKENTSLSQFNMGGGKVSFSDRHGSTIELTDVSGKLADELRYFFKTFDERYLFSWERNFKVVNIMQYPHNPFGDLTKLSDEELSTALCSAEQARIGSSNFGLTAPLWAKRYNSYCVKLKNDIEKEIARRNE